ncbi:MAG: glycosyltransferase family 39 protein, partial [Planctomycetaceae bacterium]|nr:glycosyltransferase family 39 protein [Planctomycetaceae bacterium]
MYDSSETDVPPSRTLPQVPLRPELSAESYSDDSLTVRRSDSVEGSGQETARSAEYRQESPGSSDRGVLAAILLLGLGLRLFYFVGISGHDDISYFNHALEVLNGTFSTELVPDGSFPFRFRVGLIFSTALMFRLFGVSEYTAAILPVLNSLGLVVLAWWGGRRITRTTGTLAAFLAATFPLDVVQATSLWPTPFAAFFTGLSVLLWLSAEDRCFPGTGIRNGLHWMHFASGLSLGTAYLFRIEAGLFVLFFVSWFLLYRRSLTGVLAVLTTSAFVVGLENIVYWRLHGEWFYHLKAISGSFAEINDQLAATVTAKKSPWLYLSSIFLKPAELGLHWAVILPA